MLRYEGAGADHEEEGKDFFGCLLGYCTVCNIMADA